MIPLLLQLKAICEQTIIAMLALISLYMPFGGIGDVPVLTQEQQILQQIETAQISYFKTHGRYFQGLPTFKTAPTAISTPDNLSIKPHYQTEKWSDFITLPPMSKGIMITQYQAPTGDGYQVIFYWQNNGRLYKSSVGYGVEAKDRTFEMNCLLGSKFCGV